MDEHAVGDAPKEPRAKSATGAKPLANAPMVKADINKPSRTYKPRELFAVGDRIDHPTFGLGVVELLPSPGKMQVFFPSGRKLLVCGLPGSAVAAATN